MYEPHAAAQQSDKSRSECSLQGTRQSAMEPIDIGGLGKTCVDAVAVTFRLADKPAARNSQRPQIKLRSPPQFKQVQLGYCGQQQLTCLHNPTELKLSLENHLAWLMIVLWSVLHPCHVSSQILRSQRQLTTAMMQMIMWRRSLNLATRTPRRELNCKRFRLVSRATDVAQRIFIVNDFSRNR